MLDESVIQHLRNNCQTSGPEVGGQLFGIIEGGNVIISLATGPRIERHSSRFLFIPCRLKERKEIRQIFKQGLHFLGDWHTHPEKYPTPSKLDIDSMRDCFIKSRHEHSSFIMIIVGNETTSESLWISIHNKTGFIRLRPMLDDELLD